MSGQFVRGSSTSELRGRATPSSRTGHGTSSQVSSSEKKVSLSGPGKEEAPPGRRKPVGDRRETLPRPLPHAFLCCPKELLIWGEPWTLPCFLCVWLGMFARGQH